MAQTLGAVALIVRDYDEAITFYCGKLGFLLVENTPLAPEKRWVKVAPAGGGSALLLAKSANADQARAIGHQSGGRVFLFLETDDFAGDFTRLRANGVEFLDAPRQEDYGQVVVFRDLYGNKWDLVQYRR
jgi:catechol 2,3-dioxygenase-like lactoylglutathione lyase family enzyme